MAMMRTIEDCHACIVEYEDLKCVVQADDSQFVVHDDAVLQVHGHHRGYAQRQGGIQCFGLLLFHTILIAVRDAVADANSRGACVQAPLMRSAAAGSATMLSEYSFCCDSTFTAGEGSKVINDDVLVTMAGIPKGRR